jgi:predicted nucleic acid-binding protein
VRRVVADASVIVDWFDPDSPHRSLRAEYEAGSLAIIGPRTLITDALDEVVRRQSVPADRLPRIATELQRLGFQLRDAPIGELAGWMARGLPGHRAAYAALASALEVPLVTDDPELRRIAATVLPSG